MKKRKLYIILLGILCLLGLFTLRVYSVNKNLDLPITQEYELGEMVPYENDFTTLSDEIIDGYSVKVLTSEVLPVDEFYKKYQLTQDTLSVTVYTKYYYLLKVLFRNENPKTDTSKGVNLLDAALLGTNYYMMIDAQMFALLNPKFPSIAFGLRGNSELEMLLPYAVTPEVQTDLAGFKKDPPKLQITEYPHRKLLKVN